MFELRSRRRGTHNDGHQGASHFFWLVLLAGKMPPQRLVGMTNLGCALGIIPGPHSRTVSEATVFAPLPELTGWYDSAMCH